MKLLLLSLALVAAVAADKCKEKCAKCPVLERSECLAGMSKDNECDCCDVCNRIEGQACDMANATYHHGKCGYGLDCQSNKGGKNTCICSWNEIICGTDGVTYNNLCHLMATGVRMGSQDNLKVKSVGPCEPGASIVSEPSYIRNYTGSNIVLSCEAIGFPTPAIFWEMQRASSKVVQMPGDDDHILTAMRGGPGKYQVTAWLQIEGLHKRHEGDYTCVAVNEHRESRATARVKVAN